MIKIRIYYDFSLGGKNCPAANCPGGKNVRWANCPGEKNCPSSKLSGLKVKIMDARKKITMSGPGFELSSYVLLAHLNVNMAEPLSITLSDICWKKGNIKLYEVIWLWQWFVPLQIVCHRNCLRANRHFLLRIY